MFIQRKNYLSKIARIRVSEGRDLDHGLRLDRNEKVDVWPIQMLADIFPSKPDWFLSVYPESRALPEAREIPRRDESEMLLRRASTAASRRSTK